MILPMIIFGVHLSAIFLLCYWWWRKQQNEVRPYFWPALIIKLGAGIGLGLLYRYYYYSLGDTFSFFDDGAKLSNFFWKDPRAYANFLSSSDELNPIWNLLDNKQPRSLFLVKVISVVNIFTANNYWTTSLYFSLASFAASFWLVQKMTFAFPGNKLAAVIAFLFFPSVVFWSSGIIKESLAMAGLFLLSGLCITLLTNRKVLWWEWMLAVLALPVVWNLKYYWIAVFMPVAVTTIVVHLTTKRLSMNFKIMIWATSFAMLCLMVTLVHPNFYLENFLNVLLENYKQFIRISPADDVVYYSLEPTWWSVFLNSPLALLSGLFRPFIWEATNVLQVIVAIENFFVLGLFISSLSKIKVFAKSSNRLLIVSTLAYILILCLFLSLSTPNLGTLARYKVGFQPFFIFILLADSTLINWTEKKLKQFLT